MIAKVIKNKFNKIPDELKEIVFSTENVYDITIGNEYEIYAISNFSSVFFFQIINDLKLPHWIPSIVFEVIDKKIPEDWFCNFFLEEPLMVMGPDFISKDIEAYKRMVEGCPEEYKLFKNRIKNLEEEKLRKFYISIPKNKEALVALEYKKVGKKEVLEIILSDNDFQELEKLGLFKIINEKCGSTIKKHSNESISDLSDLKKCEDIVIDLISENIDIELLQDLVILIQEAINRKTGIFFVFN